MSEKVPRHILAIALLVMACTANRAGDASLRTRTTHTAATLETLSAHRDRELALAVRRRIATHDNAESVIVRVDRHVVVLEGHLPHVLAKKHVEAIAAQTFGVLRVWNRIDVRPPERVDAMIENDVRRALSLHPVLQSEEIDVVVDGGDVTLAGDVASHHQRAVSEEIAAGVRGVKNVVVRLEIVPPREYVDDQLRARIAKQLDRDMRIDSRRIHLRVRDGRVVLTGTVSSENERRLARYLSGIDGVREVNASALHVRWSPMSYERRVHPMPNRDAMTRTIHRALECNGWQGVENLALHVDRDGVVTIEGEVSNVLAKRATLELIETTRGVTRLIDRITVLPHPLIDDELLEERVSDILGMNPYLENERIELRVQDGIVMLIGNVRSPFARTEADRSASQVAGVRGIDNRLETRIQADGW